MYNLAVKQNPWALEYVPEVMQTEEMCLSAVQRNNIVLHYVKKEIRQKIKDLLGIYS